MTLSNPTPITRLLCVVLVTAVFAGGVVTATPGSTATLEADQEPTDQVPVTSQSSTAPAELRLDVVEETGSTVTVSLSTTAENTIAYAAGLTFDPDVVTIESVDGADFDSPYTNVEDGRVTFTQSTISDQAVDAPELARITFELDGEGQTTLEFVEGDTIVENANIESVPLSVTALTIGADGGSVGVPDAGDDTSDASDQSAASERDSDDDSVDGSTDQSAAGANSSASAGSSEVGSSSNETGSTSTDTTGSDDGDGVPGFAGSGAILAVIAVLALRRARVE